MKIILNVLEYFYQILSQFDYVYCNNMIENYRDIPLSDNNDYIKRVAHQPIEYNYLLSANQNYQNYLAFNDSFDLRDIPITVWYGFGNYLVISSRIMARC